MSQKRIQQIERRIDRIKRALLEIGPMRPGSLTRQYEDPQHQAGAYWQISYTAAHYNRDIRRHEHTVNKASSEYYMSLYLCASVYTRQMKSRTEYVRKEYVKEVRRQTVTHKRFKRLVDQWIDLSIEHSRLAMRIAESKASR